MYKKIKLIPKRTDSIRIRLRYFFVDLWDGDYAYVKYAFSDDYASILWDDWNILYQTNHHFDDCYKSTWRPQRGYPDGGLNDRGANHHSHKSRNQFVPFQICTHYI